MKHTIIALIIAMCAVASVLTYLDDKATNGGLPLVQTSEPASAVPWRLYTPCTPNRTNVPLYKERTA